MMNDLAGNFWAGSEWRAVNTNGILSEQADKPLSWGIRHDLVKMARRIRTTSPLVPAKGPVQRPDSAYQ